MMKQHAAAAVLLLGWLALPAQAAPQGTSGWPSWRGPNQNGTSNETGLPEAVTVGGENLSLIHI